MFRRIYTPVTRTRSRIEFVTQGFSKSLRLLDHTRRFSIARQGDGWQVREERDNKIIREVLYQDWHRVERARQSFAITLDELTKKGWAEN